MKRGQTLLHICSRPGFFRACDHDPDLSRIGVGEGSGLLGWRLEVMNESDFVGGNAALDQFALSRRRCRHGRAVCSPGLQTAAFFARYSCWTVFQGIAADALYFYTCWLNM